MKRVSIFKIEIHPQLVGRNRRNRFSRLFLKIYNFIKTFAPKKRIELKKEGDLLYELEERGEALGIVDCHDVDARARLLAPDLLDEGAKVLHVELQVLLFH